MPFEIEHEGARVSVYTDDDVHTAVAAAREGLIAPDEAQRLADSAAAHARRAADGDIKALQAQLAQAATVGAELDAVKRALAAAADERTAAQRTLAGVKVLLGAGVAPAVAEELLALPSMASSDFTTESGAQAALETLRAQFPVLVSGALGAPAAGGAGVGPRGGVGSSPTPPATRDLSALPIQEYIAARRS